MIKKTLRRYRNTRNITRSHVAAKATLDEGQPAKRSVHVRGHSTDRAHAQVVAWNMLPTIIYSSHGTNSKVQFILSGEDSTTKVIWYLVLRQPVCYRYGHFQTPWRTSSRRVLWRLSWWPLTSRYGSLTITLVFLQAFGTPGEPADLARQQWSAGNAALVPQLRHPTRFADGTKV